MHLMRLATLPLLAATLVLSSLPAQAAVPAAAPAATAKSAARPSPACASVEAVWARGSGQSLGDRHQFARWDGQLRQRIKAPLTLNVYELGSKAQGGYKYPAVNVSDPTNGNAVGAKLSSGYGNDYGNSVSAGVLEYISYLTSRSAACPNSLFVAGGFSQGAQVIGQAYSWMASALRNRVVYNTLFGDPKLNLPEGRGLWPAACRGGPVSPWRRRIANCMVDNGSLGARDPYLPATHTGATGLWCADKDFVCGSSKVLLINSGHDYSQAGGDIDAGVEQAVERLKARKPAYSSALDTSVGVIGTGTTGLDVVFVIDSTGSMGGTIDQAKQFAASMATRVRALRGRVAIVEYRDAGDSFVARIDVDLTDDVDEFQAALNEIAVAGGGDTPEATLAALMHAFDNLEWRPGATKAAVVLTDAPYHDPDVATGVTTSQVAARSLEIDPVNVYPIVPAGQEESYTELAGTTSGEVMVDDGDAEAALEETFSKLENRPVALLAQSEYYAQPGVEVTYDASDSYATEGTVSGYDWDFDGDGTFDLHTNEPTAKHTYSEPFEGQASVQVTDSNDLISSASVPVHVSNTPPPDATSGGPGAPTGLKAVPAKSSGGKRDVALSWVPAVGDPDKWSVALNGVELGTLAGDRRSIIVSDVPAASATTLSITGVAADTTYGASASVRVAADPAAAAAAVPRPTISRVTKIARPRLTWTAGAARSAYEVRYRDASARSKEFSAWRAPTSLTGLVPRSALSPAVSPGVTRCFSVRALTSTGPTAWSRSACTSRPLDDRALAAKKFSRGRGTGYYAGTFSTSKNQRKGALSLAGVRSAQLGVLVRRCKTCGPLRVMLNGTLLRTVKTRRVPGTPASMTVYLPYRTINGATIRLRPKKHKKVIVDGLVVMRRGG